MLFVFVRRALAAGVSELATLRISRGLGGTLGNKGAIAARFSLGGASWCFVVAHL